MNNTKEVKDFISKVPLFRGLQSSHIERIAKRMREREYDSGEEIIEQDKMGIGLFVIVKGNVRVKRHHVDGTSLEIDNLGAGDFFGELSLLDDAVRSASVYADGATTCLVLSKLDLLEELEHEPSMAIEMLKELAGRFRRIVTHL